MGNSMKREIQVIIEGRPGAGKSSALFHLKNGETLLTPTPGSEGFYVERATHAGTKLNVWEVQPSSTVVREKSFTIAKAVVFVVDSTEVSAGVQQARRDLDELLTALASQKPRTCNTVLVLANKQDSPGALTPAAVERAFDLSSRADGKTWKWTVQGCSAKQGLGLKEGMDWLAMAVRAKNASSLPRPKRNSIGNGSNISSSSNTNRMSRRSSGELRGGGGGGGGGGGREMFDAQFAAMQAPISST